MNVYKKFNYSKEFLVIYGLVINHINKNNKIFNF